MPSPSSPAGCSTGSFTRAYLPDAPGLDDDPWLSALDADRRATLLAVRDAESSLRFDLRLQGGAETVFLTFPGHRGGARP